MGNACYTDDYVFDVENNSYYKVKLSNPYLLILNLTDIGTFKPLSYIGVNEKYLSEARNYVFELTLSKKTTMARNDEEKNEELRKVSRECIMEVYRKMKSYKNENESLINQIKIHYIKGDQRILEKYGMNISLEKFIEKYFKSFTKKVTFIDDEPKKIDIYSYLNLLLHDL